MVEPLEECETVHELEARATHLATIRDDEVDASRISTNCGVELGRDQERDEFGMW